MNYKHQGKSKIVKNIPVVDNNRGSFVDRETTKQQWTFTKAKWKCLNTIL